LIVDEPYNLETDQGIGFLRPFPPLLCLFPSIPCLYLSPLGFPSISISLPFCFPVLPLTSAPLLAARRCDRCDDSSSSSSGSRYSHSDIQTFSGVFRAENPAFCVHITAMCLLHATIVKINNLCSIDMQAWIQDSVVQDQDSDAQGQGQIRHTA